MRRLRNTAITSVCSRRGCDTTCSQRKFPGKTSAIARTGRALMGRSVASGQRAQASTLRMDPELFELSGCALSSNWLMELVDELLELEL